MFIIIIIIVVAAVQNGSAACFDEALGTVCATCGARTKFKYTVQRLVSLLPAALCPPEKSSQNQTVRSSAQRQYGTPPAGVVPGVGEVPPLAWAGFTGRGPPGPFPFHPYHNPAAQNFLCRTPLKLSPSTQHHTGPVEFSLTRPLPPSIGIGFSFCVCCTRRFFSPLLIFPPVRRHATVVACLRRLRSRPRPTPSLLRGNPFLRPAWDLHRAAIESLSPSVACVCLFERF